MNDLKLIGMDLPVGGSERIVCPVCHGGSTREASMIVTRDHEGVMYYCHRASCGVSGGRRNHSVVYTTQNPMPDRRKYQGELWPLDDDDIEELSRCTGFDDEDIAKARPRKAGEHKFAFPILGPLKERRGWVIRNYGLGGPKARTFMEANEPRCSYYREDDWSRTSEVWLVEDIPSAVRLSKLVDSVACLGMPTDATMQEVAGHYRRATLALDPDAFLKACNVQRSYTALFEKLAIVALPDDPKDLPVEILRAYVNKQET